MKINFQFQQNSFKSVFLNKQDKRPNVNRVSNISFSSNDIPDSFNIDQVKFDRGKATVKSTGENLTGKIFHKGKDGVEYHLQYKDGVIQKAKRDSRRFNVSMQDIEKTYFTQNGEKYVTKQIGFGFPKKINVTQLKNDAIEAQRGNNASGVKKKALTEKEREEIIKELEIAGEERFLKRLSEYGDSVFRKAVFFIEHGARYDRCDFEEISELSNEQTERALEIMDKFDEPIYMDLACKIARLDQKTGDLICDLKKAGADIEYKFGDLVGLNDEEAERALDAVRIYKDCGRIAEIGKDKRIYDIFKMLEREGVFDIVTTDMGRNSVIMYLPWFNDKTVKRFEELLENGLKIDGSDSSSTFHRAHFEKLQSLSDEQYQRALNSIKDGVQATLYTIVEASKYNDEEYAKIIDAIKSGITEHPLNYDSLLKLNDEEFERAKLLARPGISDRYIIDTAAKGEKAFKRAGILLSEFEKNYSYPGVSDLSDEDFEKMIQLARAHVRSCDEAYHIVRHTDEKTFPRALKLASYNIPDYHVKTDLSLSDDKYEAEDKKLADISKYIKPLSEPDDDPIIEISEEERKRIIKSLKKAGIYVNNDFSIKELAQAWLFVYVGNNNQVFESDLTARLLPLACERYESKEGAPLARWITVNDPKEFVKNMPDLGEIYSYDKIQSFAKTLDGAEKFEGGFFSDSDGRGNVRFVVYPKSEKTCAYDIGEGPYGNEEAIYLPGQKFRVLHKTSDVRDVLVDAWLHKKRREEIFTVYMQEV